MSIFNGTFTFVSQDNFENYLKAYDIGMIQRNLIASTKPQLVMEAQEGRMSLTHVTTLKIKTTSIPLDQEYSADPFDFGKASSCITTAESDVLITRAVSDPSSTYTIKFTDDGIVLTLSTKGVTATRTFKRV